MERKVGFLVHSASMSLFGNCTESLDLRSCCKIEGNDLKRC